MYLSFFLLSHVVVLPNHVPSFAHDRTRDPESLYPLLQEKDAQEPNENPHERKTMSPKRGRWSAGHDIPAQK